MAPVLPVICCMYGGDAQGFSLNVNKYTKMRTWSLISASGVSGLLRNRIAGGARGFIKDY